MALAHRIGCTSQEISDQAAHLSRAWNSPVVVTLGPAGAWCAAGGVTEHFDAVRVERVVDTTGAGDAFVGAMAAALSLGKPLREAVRWGLAAGAVAVASDGAQGGRATPERIRTLLGDAD